MAQVLIVDDSKFFGSLIQSEVALQLHFGVKWVENYSDAVRLIESKKHEFFVALLDLNLPDAPHGEIVDFVVSQGIPSIIFTGEFDPKLRDKIWAKKVVDYVLKESHHNIDYIVALIRRIHRNKTIKVLVVDDSKTARLHICNLLEVHQFEVLEAVDGADAFATLEKHPDIKMVLTDYNMPKINGFQLTEKIRNKYSKNEVAIIGLSAQGNNVLSAQFIKHGANDFINKPFLTEEFYCRVTQNIELIETMQIIKQAAQKDFLTDLYNRRYFFELGNKFHASSKRKQITIAIGLLDIDHFKKINDTYGHDIGDMVLKKVAEVLKKRFRETDIVCRYGGEEFCILANNMDPKLTFKIFDDLRKSIKKIQVTVEEKKLKVSVSIGVCTTVMDSLSDMVTKADELLYQAKEGGRNRVVIDTK